MDYVQKVVEKISSALDLTALVENINVVRIKTSAGVGRIIYPSLNPNYSFQAMFTCDKPSPRSKEECVPLRVTPFGECVIQRLKEQSIATRYYLEGFSSGGSPTVWLYLSRITDSPEKPPSPLVEVEKTTVEDTREFLYLLKLKEGKYYVGKSENPETRFRSHCDGLGAAFTSKYKPLSMEILGRVTSPFDEDNQVKKLMQQYGIDEVRGGTYSQITLTKDAHDFLQKELWHAEGKCVGCGGVGHFIGECGQK